MEPGKLLRRFYAPDNTRWIDLCETPDGQFFFQEFFEDEEYVIGMGMDRFVAPGPRSRFYARQDEAERDLKETTPWLRDNAG